MSSSKRLIKWERGTKREPAGAEKTRRQKEAQSAPGYSRDSEGLATLVADAKKGDITAYGELYKRFYNRILAYALARIGNSSEAEDQAQDTFIGAFRRIKDFEGDETAFTSWLFRIAHNISVDSYRKHACHERVHHSGRLVDPPQAEPEEMVLADLENERVREAVGRLSKDQQYVLQLRFSAQLSTREIAKTIGRTEGAVKVLQHRALVRLRKILDVS